MATIPPIHSNPPGALAKSKDPFSTFPLPEGTKPSLTRLHYVLCNEDNQGDTLSQLPETPAQNQVHLGFACWMNYDILATQKTPRAILCDFDDNMIALLDLVKEVVLESQSPSEFIESFWSRLEENPHIDFRGIIGTKTMLDKSAFADLVTSSGWLSNPDSFQAIKEMYANGKIIHRELDITREDSFTQLERWREENQLSFSTIYTSNIAEWLHHTRGAEEKMIANIDRLASPDTSVISAQKKTLLRGGERPVQKITEGSHPRLSYERASRPRKRLMHGDAPQALSFN